MTEEVIVCPKVRAKVKNDLALFNLEGAAMRTLKARRNESKPGKKAGLNGRGSCKALRNRFKAQDRGFESKKETQWNERALDVRPKRGIWNLC